MLKHRRHPLHPALGALSWLGTPMKRTAEALGSTPSELSRWLQGATPLPATASIQAWDFARFEADKERAQLEALLSKPTQHERHKIDVHVICVRRAYEMLFGDRLSFGVDR